jgi:hypothetical protein
MQRKLKGEQSISSNLTSNFESKRLLRLGVDRWSDRFTRSNALLRLLFRVEKFGSGLESDRSA